VVTWLPGIEIHSEELEHAARRKKILQLFEDEDVKRLLARKEVVEFLSTDNLCHKGFRSAVDKILALESGFEYDLEEETFDLKSEFDTVESVLREHYPEHFPAGLARIPGHVLEESMSIGFHVDRNLKRTVKASERILQRYERDVARQHATIRAYNPNVDVLDAVTVLTCPRCRAPILRERTTHAPHLEIVRGIPAGSVECIVCRSQLDARTAQRVDLHFMKRAIQEVWMKGVWLEDYISRLLRLMGWRTWTHVYAFGSSGIRHQVDVLGEKKGFVLLCECKTGRLGEETYSTCGQ